MDVKKLKALAEAAVDDFGAFDPSEAEQEFMCRITPAAVLELIARLEGMTRDRDDCLQAREHYVAKVGDLTAENYRLTQRLMGVMTRHFAKQLKDGADNRQLDECLSEGIAMLEAERDQLKAEVERLRAVNFDYQVGAAAADDEIKVLRNQVAALQSGANSWQSGYDKGRKDGTKHRQSEVKQLQVELETLRMDRARMWGELYRIGYENPELEPRCAKARAGEASA